MRKDFKQIISEVKRLLALLITVQMICWHSVNIAWGAEYDSLIDAIQATTTPRTYTLDGNETSSTALGNIGGWNSVLTIDGGEGHYGINNTSTATDTRLFVGKNQTFYLQNLGTYTTTTSSSIVEGVDIITEVTVGNSINNFGKTSDRVGFLRSAGTSHISNSVFYNNRGRYGVVQNREQGTMSITGSVFANNNVPQGAVHNDGTNRMTEISDSIFYNNTAVTQTSGDTDLRNRSASAIFNKPDRTIDIISGSQFIGNTTISTADGQQTGTIYNNGGTIGEISNSVFYNNSNQSGSVIHNVSSTTAAGVLNNGTITTISNSVFVQNTSVGSGAAISNTSDSIIGAITDSLFISNTATANGGAIYNEGDIAALAGTFTSNSADSNGGAIYNTGTVTITSSDGANTTFTGNTANGVSNALYNTGTVNMNAGTDSSIIFNDKITGSDGVITLGGAGVVEFNETVAGNGVTLNSGTLKLGLADSLQDATSFTVNGGTLDLRNNEVHTYQLGQSTSIGGTVGLAIDADLAGATPVADMITAAGEVTGSGSFVFSAANINVMSYADEQTPFWVQVTDENLRNYAGLGSNANIHITDNEPEGYFITYETSHDGVDAGFLRFEHDTLANAIASSVEEKAYTMGTDETLINTPALGGDSLTVNGNSQGHSITGNGGAGLAVGNGQTLSLNNIGVDSEGNVTGAGLNNFNTAVSNDANGTANIYHATFSNNTTDIDNNGVANMSGTVIFDNAQGDGTLNIAKDSDGNSSAVTVNNSLEQNNINVESANTLTNDNATITVNAALDNAGTIAGTGTSVLVINGNSGNSGTIDQGILVTAASATLTNTGALTVQTTLTNSGTIANNNDLTLAGSDITNAGTVNGTGTTYVTGNVTNKGTISQNGIQISSGQTLTNDSGATITTTDTAADAGFQNNGTVLNDGAISVAGGSNAGSITGNGTFANSGDFTNSDYIEQDTVTNSGTITTDSENLVAANGITNNGTLVYNAGSQTVSDITGDGSDNSHIELRTNDSFTIDNTIANTSIDLYDSTLTFGSNGNISGITALNVNGGGLNVLDGTITSTDLGTVNLNDEATLAIDFDLSTLTSDSFNAVVNNNGGLFNINQVNLLGTITADYVNINLGDATGLGQENVTSATIELPSVMTPIRRINGRIEDGWLTYEGTGTDIDDFNPAVLATPVVAQVGMHTMLNNTFHHAYEHADWYTKFSAQERAAILDGNRNATNNVANGGYQDKSNLRDSYKANAAIWFKSYATFEDIPLRPGPKVDVNSYGSLVGVDSDFQDWGREWYGVTTGYVGYNGAQIDYPEVKASMDGGLVGVTQTFYKNNFWTGVTANVGADFVNTRTMYGRENSSLFSTGLGTQTGYNIELGAGNFILQPIWFMNYGMIKTFDYTNAAGVKIDPKPLHTIQLNPTLRLVGNVKGWQPYASVGMVWNLMDKTDVMADSVKLPEISVKPYVRYDVGVQKAIGNRFTGFIQAAGYNGGRNGINIAGGLRWAFGKGGKNTETVKGNNGSGSAIESQNNLEPETVEPVVAVQTPDVKQETGKAETPVVNVQKTGNSQPNGKTEVPAVNTQDLAKEQKTAQTEGAVAEVQPIDKGHIDTPAEESVTNAPNVKDVRKEAQSEKSGAKTEENNNLAMAIAIGAVLLLLVFLLTRKW
ncbi:MAG: hypothetical protein IKP06_05280 [Elusimicrobiaceae bacterium]|nr:hypothetical protein [Elusimicrobiaceae bacterium]